MSLLIKPGVNLSGIRPEMVLAVFVVVSVYEEHGWVCTITSATDGVHMPGSLHVRGQACDFRTKDFPNQPGGAHQLADQISACLGRDFDVVLEKDHLHVEFDPK